MRPRIEDWSVRLPPSRVAAGLVVALGVPLGVAVTADALSDPIVELPALWLILAVIGAALVGGLLPALGAVVAGTVAVWWVIVPPTSSFAWPSGSWWAAMVIFPIAASFVALGTARFDATRRRLRLANERAQRLHSLAQALVTTSSPAVTTTIGACGPGSRR